MKNLLACLAILAAFSVGAQTETANFPYNPDSDGDGLIGVSDLVNLLGYYETQFNVSAQLNSDSTSAIHFPPDWDNNMDRIKCDSRCDSLPGPWQMLTYKGAIAHFGALRDSIYDTGGGGSYSSARNFLLSSLQNQESLGIDNTRGLGSAVFIERVDPEYAGYSSANYFYGSYQEAIWYTNQWEGICLCELRQRPRVEYDFCEGSMANIQPCAAEKVSQGWYPLELTSAGGAVFVQTFWRWED